MGNIRLPIGIQDYESLIEDGFVYVDKTKYIYELAYGSGRAFFLSRPRRFGKSLFISTLRAYWEGKRELFTGLAIEELEKDNPDGKSIRYFILISIGKTSGQRKVWRGF